MDAKRPCLIVSRLEGAVSILLGRVSLPSALIPIGSSEASAELVRSKRSENSQKKACDTGNRFNVPESKRTCAGVRKVDINISAEFVNVEN